MIEANIIARTHFTKKADGETSFWQFLKEVKLQDEGLQFKYETPSSAKKGKIWAVAESWGGYVNSNGEWVVFVCWRSSREGICWYSHWSWDSENQMPFNRRDYGFVN